jgi:hypothetical protein
VIYALFNEREPVFYVGKTNRIAARLRAHRHIYGTGTGMRIIQDEFMGETPMEAERRWVKHFLMRGVPLKNKMHAAAENRVSLLADPAMLGRRGGNARALSMSSDERREQAKKAVNVRWEKYRTSKKEDK